MFALNTVLLCTKALGFQRELSPGMFIASRSGTIFDHCLVQNYKGPDINVKRVYRHTVTAYSQYDTPLFLLFYLQGIYSN